LYVAPEFPIISSKSNYIGFQPSLVILKESNLYNIQFGFATNYLKAFGLGFYLSSGQINDFDKDVKSLIINTYARSISTNKAQIHIGFQYVHNIGGFSNVFGQTLQVNLNFLFSKDGCGNVKGSQQNCTPTFEVDDLIYFNKWQKVDR